MFGSCFRTLAVIPFQIVLLFCNQGLKRPGLSYTRRPDPCCPSMPCPSVASVWHQTGSANSVTDERTGAAEARENFHPASYPYTYIPAYTYRIQYALVQGWAQVNQLSEWNSSAGVNTRHWLLMKMTQTSCILCQYINQRVTTTDTDLW